MKKAFESGEDPYLALLNYRSTPLDCGKSPAEILMHRKLRTRLPTVTQLEKCSEGLPVKEPHLKQKQYYDRTAEPLRPLQERDIVRVRTGAMWGLKAQVLKEVAPSSYHIFTERGQVFRRNRRDLLKTSESFVDPWTPETEIGHSLLCQGAAPAGNSQPFGSDTGSVPCDQPLGSQLQAESVPTSDLPTTATPVLRKSKRLVHKPDRYIENY